MGLHEFQIQASQVQTGVGQRSVVSTSLTHGTLEVAGMVHTLDPQAIALLEEVLTIEVESDKAIVSSIIT